MPIASLGMYDDPDWRWAVDAFWRGLAGHLRQVGVHDAPSVLCRDRPLDDIWLAHDLIIAQTCGLPYRLRLRDRIRLLGRPVYALDCCGPGKYRSAILSRMEPLPLAGPIRLAVNEPTSHSGWTALALFLKQRRLAVDMGGLTVTGSHRGSIKALLAGRADLAAIDAVTLALLDMHCPGHREGLHILGWSDAFASLPMITAIARNDAKRIDQAIVQSFQDPTLEDARNALCLRGWLVADDADYEAHETAFGRANAILDQSC